MTGQFTSVLDCEAIPSENCLTRHKFLLLKLRISHKHRQRLAVVSSETVIWWKLKDALQTVQRLAKTLSPLGKTPEVPWRRLKQRVHDKTIRLLEQTKFFRGYWLGKKLIHK